MAIAGLLALLPAVVAGAVAGRRISWLLSGIAALCSAVLGIQLVTGKLLFSGDALMAAFYIGLWLAAVVAGGLLATPAGRSDGVNALTVAWFFAALLSIGIGLVQWTGALNLGIYGAELPPGGRPFGNVAQPNHLCTLSFLGLCGLLWLHQHQKVSGAAFWLGAGFLLLGMVMTQSRTGWLQIGLLLGWGLAMRARACLRITRGQLLLLGAAFAAGVLLWPAVGDALLLSTGRSIDDQMQAGARLPFWRSMLDAIGREPMWGYGWQQVGAAQQRVALDHPSVGAMFEHSHNLVLDLLLWNGVPIGGLIVAALAWWFIAHIRACRDARVVWLLAAVGGVFLHGMLEFPLEYAYFLIPVGLAMGAIDGVSPLGFASFRVPRWVALSFTALLGAVFVGVTTDYLKAEENYRTLRMESARIGAEGIVTPAPELRLLTQLGAFLQFARTEATPGMAPEQVDWMRKVSERFGYPPVMFRYALAAGLNGQPEVAQQTLARLCRIHEPPRCTEAREGWAELQVRYLQLPPFAAEKLGAKPN
ncbi:PglL family O-oligosaccharyltransferase [Acidovorax sp. JHL-9]|uniref:PglL family O-oligosaccharyltransferase n=1 Tax=Acidovorax sp. JHL-9 TaxID=1276756 RepID=UPI00138AB8E1|nr:O-antigen ligase family protein [Acidovorax sp. JHL-9]